MVKKLIVPDITSLGPSGSRPATLVRPPMTLSGGREGGCKPTCGGAGGPGGLPGQSLMSPMQPRPGPQLQQRTSIPQRSGPTTVPCGARGGPQGQTSNRPSLNQMQPPVRRPPAGNASLNPVPCPSKTGIPRPGGRPPSSTLRPSAVRRPPAVKCEKVTVKDRKTATTCPEKIDTPAGREQVLQKAILEQRLERDETGEKMVKSLKVSDFNEQKGKMDMVEVNIQQLDPHYGRTDGGKDVIGVTSTVSITPSYKTYSKECVRVSTGPTEPEIDMTPEEVAQMVAEEKEDVENTLKMVPPELVLIPGKYEMKRRLHNLRLHSESMALLEQFCFAWPMQDVVVPGEMPKDIHKEALSGVMGLLAERIAT
nr:unnamed protein product [Callosobruchus chinensis]